MVDPKICSVRTETVPRVVSAEAHHCGEDACGVYESVSEFDIVDCRGMVVDHPRACVLLDMLCF